MERTAEIKRTTAETDISVKINIDGSGKSSVKTGIPFMDHMLTLCAKHGFFDLEISATGDIEVDCHHTMEDLGIVLGDAIAKAVGDKAGIKRYGNMILPMDETLVIVALDLSGRSYLGYALEIPTQKVGTFDTELTEEFFLAFVRCCPGSLHLRKLCGTNSHHIIEGAFKAFGRAMRQAVSIEAAFAGEIPSTKGVL